MKFQKADYVSKVFRLGELFKFGATHLCDQLEGFATVPRAKNTTVTKIIVE